MPPKDSPDRLADQHIRMALTHLAQSLRSLDTSDEKQLTAVRAAFEKARSDIDGLSAEDRSAHVILERAQGHLSDALEELRPVREGNVAVSLLYGEIRDVRVRLAQESQTGEDS